MNAQDLLAVLTSSGAVIINNLTINVAETVINGDGATVNRGLPVPKSAGRVALCAPLDPWVAGYYHGARVADDATYATDEWWHRATGG